MVGARAAGLRQLRTSGLNWMFGISPPELVSVVEAVGACFAGVVPLSDSFKVARSDGSLLAVCLSAGSRVSGPGLATAFGMSKGAGCWPRAAAAIATSFLSEVVEVFEVVDSLVAMGAEGTGLTKSTLVTSIIDSVA